MRKHRLHSTPLGSVNLTSLHKATMEFPSYVQREPCHFKPRSSRSSLSACHAICSKLFSANLCLASGLPFFRIVRRKYASFDGVHSFSILSLDLSSFLRYKLRININVIRESQPASRLRNIPYDRVKRLYPT